MEDKKLVQQAKSANESRKMMKSFNYGSQIKLDKSIDVIV